MSQRRGVVSPRIVPPPNYGLRVFLVFLALVMSDGVAQCRPFTEQIDQVLFRTLEFSHQGVSLFGEPHHNAIELSNRLFSLSDLGLQAISLTAEVISFLAGSPKPLL